MNPTTILPQDEDISLWISQMSQRLEKLERQRWQPNQQNHTDDTSRSSVVVVIIPTVPTTTKEENETNPPTKQQQQQTVDVHDYYNYDCDGIHRARTAAERLCCYSAQWIWVPSHYYQLSLQQRAQLLGLSSTVHLCKSLLLETTVKKTKIITRNNHPIMDTTTRSHDNNNHNNWKTKQFVLVILQYDSTLTVGSLSVSLQRQLEKQQQKQQQDETKSSSSSSLIYSDDWRLASAEDNARLTGYGHNAISPLGMIMESEVIVVISSEIVSFQTQNISPFVVLGGGHEHVKLRISIHELCHATKAIVAPVSRPRNQGEGMED